MYPHKKSPHKKKLQPNPENKIVPPAADKSKTFSNAHSGKAKSIRLCNLLLLQETKALMGRSIIETTTY